MAIRRMFHWLGLHNVFALLPTWRALRISPKHWPSQANEHSEAQGPFPLPFPLAIATVSHHTVAAQQINITIPIPIDTSEPTHGRGININKKILITITIPIPIQIPNTNSEPSSYCRGAPDSKKFLSSQHEEVSQYQNE